MPPTATTRASLAVSSLALWILRQEGNVNNDYDGVDDNRDKDVVDDGDYDDNHDKDVGDFIHIRSFVIS